jgi:recombinational DNA repair protein RecT
MMTDVPLAGTVDLVRRPSQLIEANLSEFAKVLPASLPPEKFARWGLSVIKNGLASTDQRQRDAWLRVLDTDNEAGRLSVMSALMDCAALGLEPGRTYHLVPYGGTVNGQTDYKGEVQLITNAQKCAVIAELVREGDLFGMRGNNIPPRHEPPDPDNAASWFDDSRPVIGGYAYVDFGGGLFSQVIRMSEAEFLKRREKAKTKIVWDEHPVPMRLKSVIRPLRKTVPWSAERQWP